MVEFVRLGKMEKSKNSAIYPYCFKHPRGDSAVSVVRISVINDKKIFVSRFALDEKPSGYGFGHLLSAEDRTEIAEHFLSLKKIRLKSISNHYEYSENYAEG